MHLEERVMSGSLTGAKPIFPLPISGQTLMLSAPNCHSNLCDQDRGSLHNVPHNLNPTRCSCQGLSNNAGFNRLLLPVASHTDQCNAQLPANISSSSDSWLRIPAAAGVGRNNSAYESLLQLNGFPLYGKFNNDSYPSLDYALLANARRKNATRETTSTLKAWLNEHKKNPYPTKGEKIMLAILTKMTLTQVSTWFANARRRLKKENKMTWSPRKKSGDKKANDKDSDSCASDSDIECMDVDVDGDPDSPIPEEKESSSAKEMDFMYNNHEKSESEPEVQRPSVIRTIDSPTFNEIRDRFKDAESPVNDLQKWVNGCFQDEEEVPDFSHELTPPSTPIENKITTFSSQKLFEAFDSSKNNKSNELSVNKDESSYNSEPLHLIFSSRQPVCSTKVSSLTNEIPPREIPPSIITPQPSPKNVEFKESEVKPKIDYRVQGLTTSRELEAVLALTNLCKT